MKRELENELINKYPFLFKDSIKCMNESLMVFGCECGDGWYNILDELLENLSRCNSLYLTQVKEKFGCLTVYFDLEKPNKDVSNKAHVYTEEMFNKSASVCEMCGEPGEMRKGPWIKTLCYKCYQKK